MLLISSPRFQEHTTPPGHPERPERAEVFDRVAAAWRDEGGAVVEPRAATRAELLRVHDEAHVAAMEAANGRAVMLDPDTFTSPETWEVALLAAGAAVQAAEHAIDTRGTAVALVRPPGHHAERDKAMGFCLFNNVAVAAAAAVARGLSRVAIVDIDVHHGNGTQWMFYEDPTVLFVSSHQYPFYPGTGAPDQTGRGAGVGFTLNIPLTIGDEDDVVERKYAEAVVPRLREFRPELLMVSAGFDAHEQDPLGQLRMTTEGFARLTKMLLGVADEVCEGRVVLVTEGGYDLRALSDSLDAVVAVAMA